MQHKERQTEIKGGGMGFLSWARKKKEEIKGKTSREKAYGRNEEEKGREIERKLPERKQIGEERLREAERFERKLLERKQIGKERKRNKRD
jgi:hypothetical protein